MFSIFGNNFIIKKLIDFPRSKTLVTKYNIRRIIIVLIIEFR